jgi:hypothetical protein
VVAIESRNAAYSTTSLAAPAGQVTVVLTNYDLLWHTFTIDELHVDLEAPLGGTREATFTAAPGSYRFYCRVPAHAAAGMRGTPDHPLSRPGSWGLGDECNQTTARQAGSQGFAGLLMATSIVVPIGTRPNRAGVSSGEGCHAP